MRKVVVVGTAPAAGSAGAPLPQRRRLLRVCLGGPFVLLAASLAACGTRKDLPEERRTRGKYGHRGD